MIGRIDRRLVGHMVLVDEAHTVKEGNQQDFLRQLISASTSGFLTRVINCTGDFLDSGVL